MATGWWGQEAGRAGRASAADEAEAYRLHVVEGLTLGDVAGRLGRSATSARRLVLRHVAGTGAPGPRDHRCRRRRVDPAEAFRLRAGERLPLREAAAWLGCGETAVTNAARAHAASLPDPAAALAVLEQVTAGARQEGRLRGGERGGQVTRERHASPGDRSEIRVPDLDPLASRVWDLVHGRGLDVRRASLRLGISFGDAMELLARQKAALDIAWAVAARNAPEARESAAAREG